MILDSFPNVNIIRINNKKRQKPSSVTSTERLNIHPKMYDMIDKYIVSSSDSYRNRNIYSMAVIFILIFNIINEGVI